MQPAMSNFVLKNITDKSALFTNEEKRVETYANGDIPTKPYLVNSKTDLDKLNLNWTEKELPESERTKHVHRLHPYLGKYIPQLVEIFLRKYFKEGQTVFDPFSGSGTTLVQANELGISSIGCDISAFNVMLTKAKTKNYNVEIVKNEIKEIIELVRSKLIDTNQPELPFIPKIEGLICKNESAYLKSWFAPQALNELLIFRDLISKYENQEILSVILSRSARSARLTTHFDLDFPKKPQIEPYYCYKHRRICQPTKTAFQFLQRYSFDAIKRIEQFSVLRTNASVEIIHGDSRHVNLGKIDGVITSPPYVGLIDYHEQHRYAFELLGIEDLSNQEIGPASNGASKNAKQKYQELIADVFINALKYMPTGGRLVVVAGDKHNLYPEIAKACNVIEESVIKRHVNRRTGRRSGEFYETVFIWKKK